MKIIENTYKHSNKGFQIKVITCNKKVATTKDLKTGEIVKFNRSKLEWMIKKGIFSEITTKSKSEIMKRAWKIAKSAAAKFGGKVKEFFSMSLKMAWAE